MLNKIFLLFISFFILAAATPGILAAEEAAQEDEWEFSAEVYVWAPSIDLTTSDGNEINLSLSDILDDLEFMFMGVFGVRKDKWSLLSDVIYMDLEKDGIGTEVDVPIGPLGLSSLKVELDADVEMQAWVVTPGVGYTVLQNEKLRLDLVAGARYLYIKVDVDLDITDQLTLQLFRGDIDAIKVAEDDVSVHGHNWDGIVGVRGQVNVNDKWYLPYYADVGAGDSQLTWQVAGGVGYRFSKLDVVAGYRYLDWNWNDDDDLLGDITIKGPYGGVKFAF
jgi:hypothetical protein